MQCLITEPGVHPSLHPSSHHQIIFAKLNQEIHHPPSYFRDIWHCQDANTDLIRRAIDMFDWNRVFTNADVNEKVFILNKTIWNILSHFILHEALTVDGEDPPCFKKKKKKISCKRKTMFIEAIEILKTTTTCNTSTRRPT